MSDGNPERESLTPRDIGRDPESEDQQEAKGPNIAILYALLVLGLIAAMGFAWMVVMPFYHRR